jgi:putative transposase
MLRAYRLELYPTVAERTQLFRTEGAARWVYNWCLASWRGWNAANALELFFAAVDGRPPPVLQRPSAYSLHKILTPLKKTAALAWLNEISAYAPREACMDVGKAFDRFFRVLKKHTRGDHSECGIRRDGGCSVGEPVFRSRQRGRRWHADQANNRETNKGPLGIERGEHGSAQRIKVPGVGWVKCAGRLPPEGARLSAVGLSEQAGRWFAALRFDAPLLPQKPRIAGSVVGIETGVRELAVTSGGKRIGGVRDLDAIRKAERRRKLWERRMARRYVAGKKTAEQSRGWHEAKRMVQRYHLDATNARRDLLHKTSREIVDIGAETIVMRDQAVRKMLGRGQVVREERREATGQWSSTLAPRTREKRNKLAPMIQECGGLYELRRQVTYKQEWAGGKVLVVPSNEPTTRRCQSCRTIEANEPPYGALGASKWTCKSCGSENEREDNAAQNLKDYAGSDPGAAGGGTSRPNGSNPGTANGTEIDAAVTPQPEARPPDSDRPGKPASRKRDGKRRRNTAASAIPVGNGRGHDFDPSCNAKVPTERERCSADQNPVGARSNRVSAGTSAAVTTIASPEYGASGDRSQIGCEASVIPGDLP